MSRISQTYTQLAKHNKKALVAYIVAGDPELESTVPLMHALVEAGVDIIELGVPFSDPEAEGPVIQEAHERAFMHKTSLRSTLAISTEFRRNNQNTPVVLMGYLNPIERMGYAKFAETANQAGVDGTIIVNLPPEEGAELQAELSKQQLDSIYLVAPTTTQERGKKIACAGSGFVYYVSLKGVTGSSALNVDEVQQKVAQLKQHSKIPVAIGFGIKDGPTAKQLAPVADGIVVGSALVKAIAAAQSPQQQLIAAKQLMSEIREAIDQETVAG